MEGLIEQMNAGGQDFPLSSWIDGLEDVMTSLEPELPDNYVDASLAYGHSPSQGSQSSFVDVSSGQSPADSVYGDTLDSGPTLPAELSSFSFNQPWFDDSGNLLGSSAARAGTEKSSGFVRSSYSSVQNYSEPQLQQQHQQQRQQHQQPQGGVHLNSMSHSLLKGSELSRALSYNGSSGNLTSSGLASSISSGGSFGSELSRSLSYNGSSGNLTTSGLPSSISNGGSFGVGASQNLIPSPLGNGNRLNTAGEKYFPYSQTAPAPAVQQQEPIRNSGLNWNIPSQQTALQEQPRQRQPQPIHEPEPEDSGLQLVHLLVACAEAIQRGDLHLAEETVRKINQAVSLASHVQAGPMTRVAAHFAEALTRRIYGISANSQEAMLTSAGIKPNSLSELLQFYEICPYLKFAHFTANQTILEAFSGAKYVHVIDFNLNHGLQWPALIQALALQRGGPPSLRLTGIGPPELSGEDSLQDIGWSLTQLADSVNVPFQFRGIVANKLDDVNLRMLQGSPGEVVAVNSMFQLHKILYSDATKGAGIDDVLRAVKSLNPKVVAISEQEAKHNSVNFLDRFLQALHFYSSMFDSLEASKYRSNSSQQMLAEMYLGREICNVVACEGAERTERHETLEQWRLRMRNAGFQQVHMGENAFKQASMLLTLFSGQGYMVDHNQGCLTLCWHGKPLLAASVWMPA